MFFLSITSMDMLRGCEEEQPTTKQKWMEKCSEKHNSYGTDIRQKSSGKSFIVYFVRNSCIHLSRTKGYRLIRFRSPSIVQREKRNTEINDRNSPKDEFYY